jgi:hypothetical protein
VAAAAAAANRAHTIAAAGAATMLLSAQPACTQIKEHWQMIVPFDKNCTQDVYQERVHAQMVFFWGGGLYITTT